MAFAQTAKATATATLQLGSDSQYDDNVFRRDSQPLPAGFASSDLSDRVSAGLLGTFSFLDFNGNLNASDNRSFYQNNTSLNNNGFDINGAAHKTGDIFSNDLTLSSVRQLSSFEYIEGTTKNTQTVTQATNEARYVLANYVKLVFDLNYLKTQNSSSLYAVNNVEKGGGGLGIGYYSPTLNFINLVETFSKERGSNATDIVLNQQPALFRTDFTESMTTLNIHYAPSPISSIDGNIGYTKRFDHSILHNSASGVTGNLSFGYSPSDTLQGTLHLQRQFSAESYLFTDSVIFEGVDFKLVKAFTPQIRLTLDPYVNNYAYAFFLQAGSNLKNRNDNIYGGTIALDYAFRDMATFELQGRHEERNSNTAGLNYTDNAITFTVKVMLGSHDNPNASTQ